MTILLLIGLVEYPNLFIKKIGKYKSFEIYSNEKIELGHSFETILDSVLINLNESQFKGEKDKYELYFVRGSFYEKLIRLLGMKNIAFSKFDKHIYSAYPYFNKGILKRNDNKYEWLNLVQIISHEAVHSQMYKDYSKYWMMQTPDWINEGYSEYISYQPIRDRGNYSLSALLSKLENNNDDWIQTEYNTMTPRQYAIDRLIIEYLIDIKKMEIVEIINDETINPDDVYREVIKYIEEKQH